MINSIITKTGSYIPTVKVHNNQFLGNHFYAADGSYLVSLTATNDQGSDVFTDTVEALPLPAADFGYVADLLVVTFTNASMYADSYMWDFGDGNTSTDVDPVHTYAAAGSYTVTLEATGDCGTDTYSVMLTVSEEPCIPLTGVAIQGATAGMPGTYTFTTSYEPVGATPPIDYLWDDGGTADTSVRTFDVTGTYTLTVSATNCDGTMVEDTHVIVISEEPVCVEVTGVDLTQVTTGTLYVGNQVDFLADIMPDGFTAPYTYTIVYGDGSSDTGSSSADPMAFNYTYDTAGTYTVEFWAWNCDMTEPVTATVEVTVMEAVPEGFTIYLPVVMRQS